MRTDRHDEGNICFMQFCLMGQKPVDYFVIYFKLTTVTASYKTQSSAPHKSLPKIICPILIPVLFVACL